MLDSIYIGMTGLMGYSRGLRVIGNNVANLNTPGFKASQLHFANLFYASSDPGGQGGIPSSRSAGAGLDTPSTTLNFRQGEFRRTGNSLDLAINGEGLFVMRQEDGSLRYTRAGQFEFDSQGYLVNRADGSKVLALDGESRLVEITLEGLRANTAKATTTLRFSGNLSSDGSGHAIGSVTVNDALGGEHQLAVRFTNKAPATPGAWEVKVMHGTTEVASGEIRFVSGVPDPAASSLSLTFSPAGAAPVPLVLDFSTDVTSFAAGTTSNLAFARQDGFGAGALTAAGFDSQGRLTLEYSNGQTTTHQRLAIARFDTPQALEAVGGNLFVSRDDGAMQLGAAGAGAFGEVRSGLVELSNVDLSQEFGELIVTQRGYQASSQIVSSANEMIQQLFDMKSRR